MCISFIGIKTCISSWGDCVNNLIQFGSQNIKNCYLSLTILKNIPLIFESHSFDYGTTI